MDGYDYAIRYQDFDFCRFDFQFRFPFANLFNGKVHRNTTGLPSRFWFSFLERQSKRKGRLIPDS
jgi:hypothetical protein